MWKVTRWLNLQEDFDSFVKPLKEISAKLEKPAATAKSMGDLTKKYLQPHIGIEEKPDVVFGIYNSNGTFYVGNKPVTIR